MSTGITEGGRDVLPAADAGTPYRAKLAISGPAPSYSCELAPESALPGTLTLASDCTLGGIAPAIAGSEAGFPFQFVVTDSDGRRSRPIDQLLRVINRLAFTVPAKLPDARAEVPYNLVFVGPTNPTGGTPPYRYELKGIQPFGLNLDRGSGLLSGTPAKQEAGRTHEFEICAVDSAALQNCARTSLMVLPTPAAAATATPTPARPQVPATPTPTPEPTPTATPPAARRFTGTVTVTASYNDPGPLLGSYRVQATAVLPVDVDVSTGARSPTRTTAYSGTYSVVPTNPGCGIASSGSVAGSVRHYAQGTLDAARSQIALSITTFENSSTPDLGVCFTTANIILFGPGTSGALDSAGSTYTFPLSGGRVMRTGVLAYWQTSRVSTSYTVTAQLAPAP